VRQSDGADLLGANHRRSADIGLIYVAPADDKQSVLAAISTQDQLGREQIAVVLPERNSAFQRAVDFDELKNMQRDLQAQLVFVVPGGGTGPAEYARRRRFPVYPSLQEYAQTLLDEFQDQDAPDVGRVFGGRQTPARSPASTGAGENEEPQPPRVLPVSPPPQRAIGTGKQPKKQRTTSNSVDKDHESESPPAIPAPVPQTDEITQPGNVPPQKDVAPVPASPAPKGAGEDDVETGDIHPPSQSGPAGGLPVPVGVSALMTPPYAAHAVRSYLLAPALRRSRRRWLIAIPIVLALLVIGYFVYQPLANLIFVPAATVTITPASKDLKNTYTITAVTGTPDPAKHQVQARLLYAASSELAKTVNASGAGHTPATIATGTLTFYNSSTSPLTIPAGTVFTDASGVEIVNARDASIPAGNPPTAAQITVPAHAVHAGASGNIPAFDFNNMPCCANGVFVQNGGAFRGGQDQQIYTYVEQSDIDTATGALESSLMPGVQAALQQQIHANEQLVSSTHCIPDSSFDHAAGKQASNVTVTVMVVCTGEVYDQRAAQAMAQDLLVTDPARNPGNGYVLVGNIATTMTNATADPKGIVSLLAHAEGIWVYQFNNAQKQMLMKLIAGKSQKVAQSLLLQQEGVDKTTIHLFGGNGSTLPTDQSQITLAVLSVQGLQGVGAPASP
jgi:Baseplate J-like protein